MKGLSSFVLPDDSGVKRTITRPEAFRQDGYLANYDFRTVFYDCFREGDSLIFVAPPLINFKDELLSALQKASGNAQLDYYARDRTVEIRLKTGAEELEVSFAGIREMITPQPNESHLFEMRRVMLTQSKNNDPQWIADWFQFHAKSHGANALLLYDNNSDRYETAELEDGLQRRFPAALIKVVDWRFPFGVTGGPQQMWDSDFSQFGVLNHARFRFLRSARSVLHGDVDELIVAVDGRSSVFSAAENSPFGVIIYNGHWISDATALADGQALRHRDFLHLVPSPKNVCTPKWCTVPGRNRHDSNWEIHSISGYSGTELRSPDFKIRHFSAITSWRAVRMSTRPIAADDKIDEPLVKALQGAGLFQESNDASE
ncbi:hypothetical protein [Aestuariivirga litoralis]|uniref:hypothetical protein n=1 Tax=Aestuariivirga litoralis TaxID=2650924 RepID=UPI0018C4CE38|nr:hypothetical protein [Aestuariivirga litoralis]MBG1233299.1 hypothetical protein [Aestuariivirga litoralis]